MTFLPVVERELRVAARRRQTYWRRALAVLFTILVCLWVWIAMGSGAPQQARGPALFTTISVLAFTYCLLAGAGTTADCLSEEKREGTLGLLFLTDLRGYDIVLGKLVASSLASIYRLLAVLPVLAIPLMLGGVGIGEFWRMVLVLLNTLFLSLGSGMLASALSTSDRKAMTGAFLIVLVVAAFFPAIGAIIAISQSGPPFPQLWLLPSPGYAYALAYDSAFRLNSNHFWISLGISHALAWLFLCLAAIRLPHSWQDRPSGREAFGWRARIDRWRFGFGEARAIYRTRLLDLNPFLWLGSRDRLKPHYVFAFLGIAALAWAALCVKYPSDMLSGFTYISTALGLHTVLKFWVASEASREISENRRSGALELILATPTSIKEILNGHLLALQRQFLAPVLTVLLLDMVMFLAGTSDRTISGSGDWTLLFIVGVTVFLFDLYTVAWVSMWLGLRARSANRASGGAVTRVLVVPWVLFFLFITFLIAGAGGSGGGDLLTVWWIIALLNNVFFLSIARGRLTREFRAIATQRFDRPASASPDGTAVGAPIALPSQPALPSAGRN